TASLVMRLWQPMSALTLPTLLCLILVSALHYGCAAAAARAAAGVPLPFGELVATQFASSAANRLTPAGLGGATVTGRYFVRRGRLQPTQAAAAVSALALLGSTADVLAFATVIGLGTAAGLAGASGEVPLLLSKVIGLVPVPTGSWWLWTAAGAASAIIAMACLQRQRTAAIARRLTGGLRTYRASLGSLVRRPGRLAALMTASAATTLLLAAGFAAAATLGPAGLSASTFCALMIGYMVAAAAGNALPTPGGIGTADAALVGVLVAAQLPVAHAVAIVLAFRLVTFWAPAVIGLGLMRPLRRRGAL
ncbi:MAG: hypothetical protein QOI26_437, partial [Pseudonocardiales bacterium]|nr:hypothetical protein [Pseudonocardiales bacterium]